MSAAAAAAGSVGGGGGSGNVGGVVGAAGSGGSGAGGGSAAPGSLLAAQHRILRTLLMFEGALDGSVGARGRKAA